MSRRKRLPTDPVEAVVESLSHEGRGIVRINGKTVFVDGALPGERITFKYTGQRSRFAEGLVEDVITPSAERVTPPCEHFAICGGCSLQHLDPAAQIRHKEHVLLEQFRHSGGVEPEQILPALTGPVSGYRHKARLGVKNVLKKGKVLVGFREKNKPYIADIEHCKVLHPSVGERLSALKELINSLDSRSDIPQIEAAIGDDKTMLVIRHLVDLTVGDREKLAVFSSQNNIPILLQGNHTEILEPLLAGDVKELSYSLPDYGIRFEFEPLDFTQINFQINRLMVVRVIELMQAQASDRVLDLFCGLGNFTLPLARHAGFVTGIEGATRLVEKARRNAIINQITNVKFAKADLYVPQIQGAFLTGRFDRVLMDPPRSGAKEVIEQIDFRHVQRLVYVSCNPATLARDAGLLVKQKGFRLRSAGVMDMFPHTTHVESLAVFEKK